jgi:hypothetical protein
VKALTIIQPYAWLIVHGGKTIENRSWRTRYRGRVLIHASARATLDGIHDARLFVQREFGVHAALAMPDLGRGLELGGIIGAATIVDVLEPTPHPENPWHMPGAFGFVLEDCTPLPFYRCKGQLSLWGSFALRDGAVTLA